MSRLARKKLEAEAALKQDEVPSWIGKDHKIKLSYVVNTADSQGTTYPCLSKRFLTDPTFRVYQGEEKRAGKLVKFKRNVYVAPYELMEVCIGTKEQLWYGRITYEKHNVIRRKATRDDTWPLKEWLDKMQDVIQNALQRPSIDFILKEQPNKAATHMDFVLEIKERVNGRTVNYINPAILQRVNSDVLSKISAKDKLREFGRMTVLPPSPKKFIEYVMAVNFDAFLRLVKKGQVELAKELLKLGYLNVHAFDGMADLPRHDDADHEPHPAGQGWCALQHAAYNGRRPMVLWLLDELYVDLRQRSADGWTAMHCACKMGHFEIVKLFYERGMDLFDETQEGGGGHTPLSLMLENKHMGLVRFFIGEDSKFAQDNYKKHGKRPTHIPEDMYWYLKPLPDSVMAEIRAAQKVKANKLKAQKRAEYLAANPDAGKEKGDKSDRKSAKGSKRGQSSGASRDSKDSETTKTSASKSPSKSGPANKSVSPGKKKK